MSDERAEAHILSGVTKGSGAGWRRWTADRFSLVFRDLPAGPWTAQLQFDVIPQFIEELGPFTVQLSVNGRLLETGVFAMHGEKEMKAKVPDGLLHPGQDARIDVVTDKVWIAPSDGARLSLRLLAAGFVRQ